jgi:hypothetical protein
MIEQKANIQEDENPKREVGLSNFIHVSDPIS